MPFRSLAFVLLFALATPALADETPMATPSPTSSEASPAPTPPFDPKEVTTLQNFGLAHAECEEWSDGCAVCSHAGSAKSHCSLPGIACQPADVVCRKP